MKDVIRKGLVIGALVASAALLAAAAPEPVVPPSTIAHNNAPEFDSEGRLQFPADYRDWMFLSSGLDMSYSEARQKTSMHMYDNIFVPRAAYEEMQKTGTWPDRTIFLMEIRGASSKEAILKGGSYQTGEVMGHEAHVKDTSRFKGGWGFFSFDGGKPAGQIPYKAACYACHQAHGAVDTTFTQFYPTALEAARRLGTLSDGYLEDTKKVAEAGK